MDWLLLISYSTLTVTILSFTAGISICVKIVRKGSSADFSVAPFMTGLLSTFLWLRYALLIHDKISIAINGFGTVCFTFYLLFYYYYTLNKSSINKKIVILLAILCGIVVSGNTRSDPVYFSGLFASASSLIFASSPCTSLLEVLRTRSTEKIPFSFVISSFFVGTLWFIYGWLTNDLFVQIPNGFTALISSLQLCLFLIFPSKRQTLKGDDLVKLLDKEHQTKLDL